MTRSTHRRSARAMTTLAALAAGSLVLAGCGSDDDEQGGEAPSSPATVTASPTERESGTPLDDDAQDHKDLLAATKVSLADAARSAEAKQPDTKIVEIELDREGGGTPRWEVTLAEDDGTAHVVHVDAASGKAAAPRDSDDNDTDDRTDRATLLGDSKVDAEAAVRAATDRSSGTPVHADLDMDGGDPVWQVDVVAKDTYRETTLDVSASDGKVLREDTDD